MSQKENNCQKPENLKGDPKKCSAEQIEICHGSQDHPCNGAESK